MYLAKRKRKVDIDVLQWSADGNGGNQLGRLLTAQNFDDGGVMYQIIKRQELTAKPTQPFILLSSPSSIPPYFSGRTAQNLVFHVTSCHD
jgi:hypothetical protein